jgi:hypothetical protein
VWWHKPVILAFGKMKQEDLDFKASLGYVARPDSKQKKKRKKERKRVREWEEEKTERVEGGEQNGEDGEEGREITSSLGTTVQNH